MSTSKKGSRPKPTVNILPVFILRRIRNLLLWLWANTGKDGDIRKAIKQAMEAEGEKGG